MSLASIVLGIINIAIVIGVLILIGLLVIWIIGWLGLPMPGEIKRVYLVVVALIALYMLAALVLGLPSIGLMHATRLY